MKIGIIGFGKFGKFLAEKLGSQFSVKVFDKNVDSGKWAAGLAQVAQSDFVILAVPLESYEKVLIGIKPSLNKKSVLVDVCSVKQQPVRIIKSILPDQPLVATHPLFGPESAAESIRGHTLVLCPDVSDAVPLKKLEQLAMFLGMKVKKMSAVEHDKEIATVQGLTFFIARALKDLSLNEQTVTTPSFKKLLSLAELEKHHSDELFYTIQAGNEQTKEIRKKFIEHCQELDLSIAKGLMD